MPEPVVIATWPFGKQAADAALPLLAAGKPALDAVVAGAQEVELNPEVHSVGVGAIGNRVCQISRDACVMDGKTLSCGGVAAVEYIRKVAALARLVMEKTPHVLVVGDGALWFALQHGFPLETLHTPESVKLWYEKLPANHKRPPGEPPAPPAAPEDINVPIDEHNHDTVTVIGLDKTGHLGGVCTTSGLAYKLPGRVGDSPLVGAGLYVDDQAGAAGATGTGEEIIRVGGSFLVVELMRGGKSPQEACELACKRVNAAGVRRGVHPANVAFLAMAPTGAVGAACTERTNFQYALGRGGKVEMVKAKVVGPDV
ncbi:MAG TPA: isoaspartyl peptidase/L-asparaginase [Fimbriiglobus sp.]|nr:isoaspartyl peptidase/L-asparaginase [Fimbriiglobus sp.]